MSTTTLNAKFKLRRDTLENWTTNNPTIAAGEPILVFDGDDTKIKIGKEPNGSTFNNTEYYGGDWNSLLNKPFYTESLEAHSGTADYTGQGSESFETEEAVGKYFKFEDAPAYTAEQLKLVTISGGVYDDGQLIPGTGFNNTPITEDYLDFDTPGVIAVTYPADQESGYHGIPVFLSVLETGKTIAGVTFNETGFYGLQLDLGDSISEGASFDQPASETVHKLDSKFYDKIWDKQPLKDWDLPFPETITDKIILDLDNAYNIKLYRIGSPVQAEDFHNLTSNNREQFFLFKLYDGENNSDYTEAYINYTSYDSNYTNEIIYIQNDNYAAGFINYNDNTKAIQIPGREYIYKTLDDTGLYFFVQEVWDADPNHIDDRSYDTFNSYVYPYKILDTDGITTIAEMDINNLPQIYYPITLPPAVEQYVWAGDEITLEDFYKAKLRYHYYIGGEKQGSQTLSASQVSDGQYNDFIEMFESMAYGVYEIKGAILIVENDTSVGGMSIKKGVYCFNGIEYDYDEDTDSFIQKSQSFEAFRINQFDITPIDPIYLKVPWENITNPPFGEIKKPSFYIPGKVTYDDLSAETPITPPSEIPSGCLVYYLGDYMPFEKMNNNKVKIEYTYEFVYEDPSKNPDRNTNSKFLNLKDLSDSDDYYMYFDPDTYSEFPVLIGVANDNSDISGWHVDKAGLYTLCVTGPLSALEIEDNGVFHAWISAISYEGEDYIKPLDSKYLTDIDYAKISNTLVNEDYYEANYDNQQTFYFSDMTTQSLSITNSSYYYFKYNDTINLSENDLLTSYVTSIYDNSGNSYQTSFNYSSEIIVDRQHNYTGEVIIYYIYISNSNKLDSDYADLIYIKYKPNQGHESDSIYCNLYDKNNNGINNEYILSDELYLLRQPDPDNNLLIYGITELHTNNSSSSIIKKLHPHFIPSYLFNKETDNGVCKWIDAQTVFTPSTGYASADNPTQQNYYTIDKSSQCRTGMSNDHIVVNNVDVPNENYAQIIFNITVNEPDTLYILSENYKTENNEGRIAISYLDDYVDYYDLSNVYTQGDYDAVFSGSPPSFNVSKGKHTIRAIVWSENYIEDDSDYIDFYLDSATSKTLNYVTTLSDYLIEKISEAKNNIQVNNIPDLPAGKITSEVFDSARIPDLDASKVTSGIFDAGRIPSLSNLNGNLPYSRIYGQPESHQYQYNQSDLDSEEYVKVPVDNYTDIYYFKLRNSDKIMLDWYLRTHSIFSGHIPDYTNNTESYIHLSSSEYITETINSGTATTYKDSNYFTTYPFLIEVLATSTTIFHQTFSKGAWVQSGFTEFTLDIYGNAGTTYWDMIGNKPFGDYSSQYYRTLTSNLSSLQVTRNNVEYTYYKVDDYLPINKLLCSFLYQVKDASDNNDPNKNVQITWPLIQRTVINGGTNEQGYNYFIYGPSWCDNTMPLVISILPFSNAIYGVNGFQNGTWMLKSAETTFDRTALVSQNDTWTQTLDEKYIPNSVKHQLPQTATQGQVLTYDGTSWGAANVPTELPPVQNNSTDNGKILRVVDGVWRAVQLPSASGQSF